MIKFSISHASGARTTSATEALVTAIGSNPFCEVLVEDPSVAPRQCTIKQDLDGHVLLEARAIGMRLDGRPIEADSTVQLPSGSCLTFGGSSVVVEFDVEEIRSKKASSAYIIQLSVGEFGGMEWTEHHIISDVTGVRAALREFAESPLSRRQHAFSPDATLGVWVIQAGHVVGFVDLAACFSTTCDGEVLTLPQLKASPTHDARELLEDGVELELRIDWPSMERLLPQLVEPLMQPSETLRFVGPVDDEWLALTRGASYGSTPYEGPIDEEKDQIVKRTLSRLTGLLPPGR